MSHLRIAILAAAIAIVMIGGTSLGSQTQSTSTNSNALDTSETTEAKIERAMSAGPPEIARAAKIIEKDALGHTVVLRAGSNGFTCMPGNPNAIGDPPMCADEPSSSGLPILQRTNPSQPIVFQGSPTCSRVLPSAAIPIRTTKLARRLPSARTG